ncbi:hypothetical protein ACIRP7_02730 [Streptomyces sp. NPDC102270]|uniref:hypothetical protein n=1 Tax=Streptomyces sp. NPDC102270 TaxID=3366150 RepID=UPI0037FD2181
MKIDDEIGGTRWLCRPPQLTDSELVCLAVAQALLGFTSESRWLRFVDSRLGGMFPYVPRQPGWNKRLRAALPLVKKAIRLLPVDTDFWFDNHWIVDSTPVECGRSRPAVKRSDMAGWAGYGYCASLALGLRQGEVLALRWEALLAEAKVRDGRLHDACHTAATVLLILGVPERAVMGLMGWSTTAMAARYQHMVEAVRADVARQVDGLIWQTEAHRPEADDGMAGNLVPVR